MYNAMCDTGKKRITVKHKHPNPLFEQWLIEWRDNAKEQNSKMQFCFSLALRTLRKYPLPLESGKDCKILKGFGDKLCNMLDDKLKRYKTEICNDNAVPVVNTIKPKRTSIQVKPKSPRKSISNKEYVPHEGSGAFAILITLYEKSLEPNYSGFLTKQQIIDNAQHICDVSFTKHGPDSWYTGWSSMKTLLEKNLVKKEGKPAKFSLTEEGNVLADTLYVKRKVEEFQKQEEEELSCAQVNTNNPLCTKSSTDADHNSKKPLIKSLSSEKNNEPIWCQASSTASTSSQSSTAHETVIIAPNSFEIVLIVDTQELNGSKSDPENDPIIATLTSLNVCHEVRNLKIGDYTWICRDSFGNEMVLPYIIERKRMDDLGKSIKDDRFHEQKFRLKQCGIENLIYLIESYGKNEHVGLPINTLYQAAINTLVHDGFSVKFTDNGKASCEYLASLTKFFNKYFKDKTLVSCPKEDIPKLNLDDDLIHLMLFKDFNKSSAKTRNFKIKEMFVKHLLQIKGMSVDKALAIVEKYPTPKHLKLSYEEISECQREKLLSNIQYGTLKKNVGPVLSRIVYMFFCNNVY